MDGLSYHVLYAALTLMLLATAFVMGRSKVFSEAFVLSLADKRLERLQDANVAAYEMWKVMRDSPTHRSDDFFIGYSHALNMCDVITDEEWMSVRVATGGDC